MDNQGCEKISFLSAAEVHTGSAHKIAHQTDQKLPHTVQDRLVIHLLFGASFATAVAAAELHGLSQRAAEEMGKKVLAHLQQRPFGHADVEVQHLGCAKQLNISGARPGWSSLWRCCRRRRAAKGPAPSPRTSKAVP